MCGACSSCNWLSEIKQGARSVSTCSLPPMADQKGLRNDCIDIKVKDGITRDSHTGELVHGKQVLRPVRFFLTDPWLLQE